MISISFKVNFHPPKNVDNPAANGGSSKLLKLGCLSQRQFSLQLSPSQKLLLSIISFPTRSPYAQAQNGGVDLSNQQLAARSHGLFSPRQVLRHLRVLEASGAVTVCYYGSKRMIYLPNHTKNDFMVPVVGLKDSSPSETVILSSLLNQSAFNARASIGFTLNDAQELLLPGKLSLNEKTVKLALNRLRSLGFIEYFFSDVKNRVLRAPKFTRLLAAQYASIIKLKISKKCVEIMRHRAVAGVVKAVRRRYPYSKALSFLRKSANAVDKTKSVMSVSELWRLLCVQSRLLDSAQSPAPFQFSLKQILNIFLSRNFLEKKVFSTT